MIIDERGVKTCIENTIIHERGKKKQEKETLSLSGVSQEPLRSFLGASQEALRSLSRASQEPLSFSGASQEPLRSVAQAF